MSVCAPEVSKEGLVLWRLHQTPEESLCCLVAASDRSLVLAVRSEGQRLLIESHHDIVELVKRSDMLRATYIRHGWLELPEIAEPDETIDPPTL